MNAKLQAAQTAIIELTALVRAWSAAGVLKRQRLARETMFAVATKLPTIADAIEDRTPEAGTNERERCAAIADVIAEQERFKGAGTMLRQKRGDKTATEELITLYANRYNLAKDIAAAIRNGKVPELPEV